MDVVIKNWCESDLDECWFQENGQEQDSDKEFFNLGLLYPLSQIPFFFDVDISPKAFVLFMGELLSAAIKGEINIAEPSTLLPLTSFTQSAANGIIEVTPNWLVCAREISKFATLKQVSFVADVESFSLKVEKRLTTTERNSLLTIIAALCDYSAIKINDRGAASQIAKLTQEIGAAVSPDTVGRMLKAIPNALETRMK